MVSFKINFIYRKNITYLSVTYLFLLISADKTKLWNFSIEDYNQLMSKVAPLAPHVVLGAIPPYVLKVIN